MKKIKLLFIFFFLFSCNHKENKVNIVNVNPADTVKVVIPSFTNVDFPLKVGNWWRYKVTDFNCHCKIYDTLTVSIVSKKKLNNGYQYIVNTSNSKYGFQDSAHIEISDSLLQYNTYYPDGYSYFPAFTLKLPFKATDYWKGNIDLDSLNVISFSKNYKVLGNQFDIFYLKRIVSQFKYTNVQTIQISKKIGIVSQSVSIKSPYVNQWQDLQLVDYHLE